MALFLDGMITLQNLFCSSCTSNVMMNKDLFQKCSPPFQINTSATTTLLLYGSLYYFRSYTSSPGLCLNFEFFSPILFEERRCLWHLASRSTLFRKECLVWWRPVWCHFSQNNFWPVFEFECQLISYQPAQQLTIWLADKYGTKLKYLLLLS